MNFYFNSNQIHFLNFQDYFICFFLFLEVRMYEWKLGTVKKANLFDLPKHDESDESDLVLKTNN